jgi:hypothetical protein
MTVAELYGFADGFRGLVIVNKPGAEPEFRNLNSAAESKMFL